ncbi:AMP-binding protein [Streptomyces sp. NPDC101118]|uniref:AMP-binding protein n=1 Tax=Streptomyces sp. NPDC101118 TaxID=3366109 RepID=UPI003827A5DD
MTQASESAATGPRTAGTVTRLFAARVRDTPDAPALIAVSGTLSYAELDGRANRLAHRLLASRLPQGVTVAVALSEEADTVVALLAVLKAGGAYALLAPGAPGTAQKQLAAAAPYALLTDSRTRHTLGADKGDRRVILLEDEREAVAAQPADDPGAEPGGTAAVLFTGADGTRAVGVSHERLLAAHASWAEVAGTTPGDRHLVTARLDVTAFAAGWTRALCDGGALVLPGPARERGGDLRRVLAEERVTVLHTDPGWAVHLFGPRRAAAPDSLRLVTVTGDRLYVDQQATLQRRLSPGVRLLNVYGVTETAGVGTFFELARLSRPVARSESVSLLGEPFPGCRVEVQDGEIRLGPPEGGDAVPTGDRGRLREDGLLEFGGRTRDVVVSDGHTVDAYRVESELRSHEGVGGAIVARMDEGVLLRTLAVYVEPSPDEGDRAPGRPAPGSIELRRHLEGRVPKEDMPKVVVRLRALPRNRAGQEDRAALPHPPSGHATGTKYGAAQPGSPEPSGCATGCTTLIVALLAMALTDFLWTGSTDLSGVPGPWAGFFFGLYAAECLAFGAGMAFLFTGLPRMLRARRSPGLTRAAHLAVVYLLASWWPQDNAYRMAAKTDWPQQALLVYTFNIPLMVAAAIVAVYVTRRPKDTYDAD